MVHGVHGARWAFAPGRTNGVQLNMVLHRKVENLCERLCLSVDPSFSVIPEGQFVHKYSLYMCVYVYLYIYIYIYIYTYIYKLYVDTKFYLSIYLSI